MQSLLIGQLRWTRGYVVPCIVRLPSALSEEYRFNSKRLMTHGCYISCNVNIPSFYEQPDVAPQVWHFKQVPLRTRLCLARVLGTKQDTMPKGGVSVHPCPPEDAPVYPPE
jgi:hypothetical protein